MDKQAALEAALELEPGDSLTPRYRTGTAARLAGLAAATLRVWERRYQVVAPFQTESGHRLYSARQVEHLGVLNQLVRAGHGIGAIAPLPAVQLRQMLDHEHHLGGGAGTLSPVLRGGVAEAPAGITWVIGRGLAQRLTRLAIADTVGATTLLRSADRPNSGAAMRVFDDLDSAAADHTLAPDAGGVLVAHIASLQFETAQRLLALTRRLGAGRLAVLYGFGTQRVLAGLEAQGALLLREPVSDRALAAALATAQATVQSTAPVRAAALGSAPGDSELTANLAGTPAIQPRRYDDAALAWFAATSPQLACECPRHLADILAQLCAFEIYSSECAHRSPADQTLHAQLHRTAAQARTWFETALDGVAQAEGLVCPSPVMTAPR